MNSDGLDLNERTGGVVELQTIVRLGRLLLVLRISPRVTVRSLDPVLELGSIVLSTFFILKLHSFGAETYGPRRMVLTG
ncbi:hypothetical protein D3C85_1269320 [compost metagenome]